ncbi:MAG TPA: hypothetical protein VEQ85_13675 [Lacipirellulaceae bacterium]|nr:hypothetical protein [Lacipirellulaceae bacterium]
MTFFARRRVIHSLLTLTALGAVACVAAWLENNLRPSSYFTGWVLLATILFLASLQLRKKIPAPSLGSASAWLQAHVYAGLATAALFAMHAGVSWPRGWLEAGLAMLYAATFVSGVVGLYWTRTLPRRLSRLGEEVVYERIAATRGLLRDRAQATVLGAVRSAGATTLGEFYRDRLHDYFSSRRGWRYRLWPTSQLRKALLADLTETTRYLSDAERKTAEDLFSLVRSRDDLDYHEALQWRLRVWLFVHIGLTYPLLAAAALHAWLAHLFSGAGV